MTKKVFTVTCTWAPSYGAVLQAYALARAVQDFGFETKVLNYQPEWAHPSGASRRVASSLKERLFDRQYLNFLHKEGIVTRQTYRSGSEIRNARLDADAFIVGSDQVWNCTKYYNGKDDAMFLDFAVSGQKRIAYAASLAMPDVPSDQADRYKNLLDKFDAISVRERTGETALQAIGVNDIDTVIDPVYLVSQSEWSKLAEKSTINVQDDEYMVVVCLEDRDELYEYARRKADTLGVRLYSFRGGAKGWQKHSVVDKNFWNISVYDYLNIMRNARAVVADSFHAMSFSLIFNVDIDIIPRNDKGNSRMVDLLSELGIADRITDSDSMLVDAIDYELVNARIVSKVESAVSFLRMSLADKEEGRQLP